MSIILLTHPRSGSTKIIKCLSSYYNETHQILNLGEFFYLKNKLNYGFLKKGPTGSQIKTKKLVDDSLVSVDIFIENENTLRTHILDELDRRKKHLNSLTEQNRIYIFKYFFDKSLLPEFYSDVERNVIGMANTKKLFLHRQNIIESVMSHIIKDQVIDRKFCNKLNIKDFNSLGHNYGNHPEIDKHQKIHINKTQFDTYFSIFINYFLYYQKKYLEHESLIYEKVFVDDLFRFTYKDINHKVLLNLDLEKKMQYPIEKKDFFINYFEIKNFLYQSVKEHNLNIFFDRCGIIYG